MLSGRSAPYCRLVETLTIRQAARGTVQGDTWTWLSESKVGGKVIKARFIYKQVSADTATMKSEFQGDDGRWNLGMEMKARRVK